MMTLPNLIVRVNSGMQMSFCQPSWYSHDHIATYIEMKLRVIIHFADVDIVEESRAVW